MTDLLVVADLTPFATISEDKAQAMIDDAIAWAGIVAPCLTDAESLTVQQVSAVKAVLRAAVLRWNDSGTGAVSSQTAGPFAQTLDTRTPRRVMFWPSEIAALQKICAGSTDGGAFSIDTAAAQPMRSHPVFFGSYGGGYEYGAVEFDDDSNPLEFL